MPCDIADIPVVDVVVISHNHYDHLDHNTVMKLKKRHPDAWYFVPLGNKAWFAPPSTTCGSLAKMACVRSRPFSDNASVSTGLPVPASRNVSN